MKLEDKVVLYFSSVDWNYTWQRQQELASRLAKKNTVLYITKIGSFNYGPISMIRKAVERLRMNKTQGVGARYQIPDNLSVANFFIIPWHNNRLIDIINRWLLTTQIRKRLKKMGLSRKVVLWTNNPSRTVSQLKKTLDPELMIYDNPMRYEEFKEASSFIVKHEKLLVQCADIVFTDNSYKYNQFRDWGAKHLLKVPQGVDLSNFDRSKTYKTPKVIQDVAHPIIGYYGGLQEVFDYELYKKQMAAFPDATFVAVGPSRSEEKLNELKKFRNFIHVDTVPVTELPKYLQHFDVALIPYVVNDYTKGTFPTKLFEYLSFAKPVVSEPIAELIQFKDYVYLANNANEFAHCIQRALDQGVKRAESIEQFVANNTWASRFTAIEHFVEEVTA